MNSLYLKIIDAIKRNKIFAAFLLLSAHLYAFDEGFESDVGIIIGTMVVDNYIATDPVGFCILDKIPLELCKKVSLDLFGETFKKYAINSDMPDNITYNLISDVKNNYHLGVDDATYDIPTAGQLVYMINNGLVANETGCYWVKIGPKIPDDIISAGWNYYGCSTTGNIKRIVTDDFPYACENKYDSCGMQFNRVTLKLNANPPVDSTKYRYLLEWVDPKSGRPQSRIVEPLGIEQTVVFPVNAVAIHVWFMQNSSRGTVYGNIEDIPPHPACYWFNYYYRPPRPGVQGGDIEEWGRCD